MVKWKLKACQRCGGDIYIDKDVDGWFSQCLNCSLRRDLSGPNGSTGSKKSANVVR